MLSFAMLSCFFLFYHVAHINELKKSARLWDLASISIQKLSWTWGMNQVLLVVLFGLVYLVFPKFLRVIEYHFVIVSIFLLIVVCREVFFKIASICHEKRYVFMFSLVSLLLCFWWPLMLSLIFFQSYLGMIILSCVFLNSFLFAIFSIFWICHYYPYLITTPFKLSIYDTVPMPFYGYVLLIGLLFLFGFIRLFIRRAA